MVKNKTIFEEQMETKSEEVSGDLYKLQFAYSARISTLVAKTCEGKEGNEFKQCFKDRSVLASQIYSLKDYFSDNFNNSRNGDNSMEISLEILKNIFNKNERTD
jgi:hypothetical protein